ncbi:MAG: hypothetical protein DRJ40_09910 [Thermoprotei archaeon]|nr:MAG: hypothetical protein DRJ40_09910 [Thermoprotei archaeon]
MYSAASLLISIALMLLLMYMKLDISLCLLAGAITLVLLTNPLLLPKVILTTLLSETFWIVFSATASICILAELFHNLGIDNEVAQTVVSIMRPKVAIMLLPAVLGLLPVAGGALLSAPLVDALSLCNSVMKAYINVWFRHTIFLAYPITNSMILISSLSGADSFSIALFNTPLMLLTVAVGYVIGVRKLEVVHLVRVRPKYTSLLTLLIPLVIALATRPLVSGFSIGIGVIASIVFIVFTYRPSSTILRKVLSSKRVWSTTLASFAVILLSFSVKMTSAYTVISGLSKHLPRDVLLLLVPYVLSLVTGSQTFSITVSASVLTASSFKDAVLIFNSSFFGYVPSPVHLCLVYSVKYYNADVVRVYKYIGPSTLLSYLFFISYALLLLS